MYTLARARALSLSSVTARRRPPTDTLSRPQADIDEQNGFGWIAMYV